MAYQIQAFVFFFLKEGRKIYFINVVDALIILLASRGLEKIWNALDKIYLNLR